MLELKARTTTDWLYFDDNNVRRLRGTLLIVISAACIFSLIVPPTYFRVSPLSLFKVDYHKPGRNSLVSYLLDKHVSSTSCGRLQITHKFFDSSLIEVGLWLLVSV